MPTFLLRPWHQGEVWRAGAFVALDIAALPVLAFHISLMVTAAGLLVFFPLAVPAVWLLFLASRGLAQVERHRTAALLGMHVPDPVGPLPPRSWWSRFEARLKSKYRWLELAHSAVRVPLGLLAWLVSFVWWWAVAFALLPAYVTLLPGDSAKFGLFEVSQGAGSLVTCAVGVLGLAVVAPWLTVGLASLNKAAASRLLGGGPSDLVRRAHRAEAGRVAAVDAAEAERRRIERDLHDGAQQRLVALAVDLGAARERMHHDPEGAARLVAEAHDEAKAALEELRDLVRGIHPTILDDRGLDAALSAVVARCPVPVDVSVELDGRLPAPVESTAYFVVTEALTNVARHAGANRAQVEIARDGRRLVVEVRDDGRGGADPTVGSGLTGLNDRVVALGGTLDVLSPLGGPTTVLAVIPCGS